MNILGLITARGGSKGIPGKNIAPVLGRPLIAWTVDAALASRRLTRTVLTTDDPAIAEAARAAGAEVPFMRQAELARDDTPHLPVLVHAVNRLTEEGWPPDVVVVLQPTSPLRTAADIDGAVDRLLASDAPSLVSVVPAVHPHLLRTMDAHGRLHPLLPLPDVHPRRQDLEPVWRMDGALFAIRTEALLAGMSLVGAGTIGFAMPPERSLDIDDPSDLQEAGRRLAAREENRQ